MPRSKHSAPFRRGWPTVQAAVTVVYGRHVETGGLYWGPSLEHGRYRYHYVSWPFARIHVSPEHLRLAVTSWTGDKVKEAFMFVRNELRAIRRMPWLFCTAFVFEHDKPGYPDLIRFSSVRPRILHAELCRFGYTVEATGL
jgi:hypothetical protein